MSKYYSIPKPLFEYMDERQTLLSKPKR